MMMDVVVKVHKIYWIDYGRNGMEIGNSDKCPRTVGGIFDKL